MAPFAPATARNSGLSTCIAISRPGAGRVRLSNTDCSVASPSPKNAKATLIVWRPFSNATPWPVLVDSSPVRPGTATAAFAKGWSRNSIPQLLKMRPPTALSAPRVSSVRTPDG